MRILALIALATIGAPSLRGQGADIILGDIPSVNSYGNGGAGTTYAYSLATTACNVGTAPLFWHGSINAHPVLAQNIYRLGSGRFQQIGMSWLKHGAGSAAGTLCGSCPGQFVYAQLGVNCSDPYTASTNGNQPSLGPRSDVNPSTGYFPFPPSNPPWSGVTARRIQCAANDINPALNGGATYFAEGQYVTPDDTAAGNQNNNSSYRQITFAPTTLTATLTGPTTQQLPAIYAWQAADPTVTIDAIDVPGDGRFIVARKITTHGNWHYEFAVRNLNSDRAARGFTVTFPPGTVITSPGFKDIAHHSGEPYSGTDWVASINGSAVTWQTESFFTNPNANALRWGTMYNFWVDATAPLNSGVSIEPFKCAQDPVVVPFDHYVADTAAPFDNPAITGNTGPTANDTSLLVPIGFTFQFWATPYTSLYISSNGFLAFDAAGVTESQNACIPSATLPNGIIAAYWNALDLTAGGQIRYATIGTAPNRRFVVHWNNLRDLGTNEFESFKIILDETTNTITSTILGSGYSGTRSTGGIERQDGLAGIQRGCNYPNTASVNTSCKYTPVSSVTPSAHLIIGGSTGPNGVLSIGLNSNANGAPVVLAASISPGPTNLGSLGLVDVGLAPGTFIFVLDGLVNPSHWTNTTCGAFEVAVPMGPVGLPTGCSIYTQGFIIAPASVLPPPNGIFHITNPVTILT